MDGTLLYENKELPPTFFDVKKDLEALGIKFILASGRQYARMRTVVQPYADDFIYITDNGTIVYEDGERILEVTIDNQLSQEIIQFTMDEMNTDHVINAVDAAYFLNGIDQEIESTFNEFYEVRKFVDDFTQVKDVVKISLFDLKDEFTGHEKLEKFSDSVNITHSGPTWLDIVDKDISKGVALKKIAETHQVPLEQVMVFGDAMNDADMLAVAGIGIIMENADERLKKLGYYMTKTNDEDGVMIVLNELLKNKGDASWLTK